MLSLLRYILYRAIIFVGNERTYSVTDTQLRHPAGIIEWILGYE